MITQASVSPLLSTEDESARQGRCRQISVAGNAEFSLLGPVPIYSLSDDSVWPLWIAADRVLGCLGGYLMPLRFRLLTTHSMLLILCLVSLSPC